jgi:hypothetical protein
MRTENPPPNHPQNLEAIACLRTSCERYFTQVRQEAKHLIDKATAWAAMEILDDDQALEPGTYDTPIEDSFVDLYKFATTSLIKKEQDTLVHIIKAGGSLPLSDLAIKLNWENPKKGFENVQSRLRKELKKLNWKLSRSNNAAHLKPFKDPSKNRDNKGE